MNIAINDFRKIKEILTKALENKLIRIANRGDIDIFVQTRIHKLRFEGRNSITDATIKSSWVQLFDQKYIHESLDTKHWGD